MESNQIVEVFDDFSPKTFIDTIETCVNSFSFDAGETAMELTLMPEEKQALFRQVIDSCIYTLAHTNHIDGRNELSAGVCRKLDPRDNPMPDVGNRFMHMHPTLQQSATKLYCCYLDMVDVPEYREAIGNLKEERGDHWYRFPLI